MPNFGACARVMKEGGTLEFQACHQVSACPKIKVGHSSSLNKAHSSYIICFVNVNTLVNTSTFITVEGQAIVLGFPMESLELCMPQI